MTTKAAGTTTTATQIIKKEKKTNLAQFLLLAYGLGVFGGFIVFYSLYRTQCSTLLTASNVDSNRTLSTLQSQCDWDSAKLKDAYETSANQESLTRQRGLLEQQTALARKHQECLVMHETALVRVSTMQQEQAMSTATVHQLREEIQSLEQGMLKSATAVEETKQRAEKQKERLQNQLLLAKTMLQEKVDEVERFKSSNDDDVQGDDGDHEPSLLSMRSSKEIIVQMQADIKKRSMAQAVRSFGEPPYTVLFMIQGQKQATTTFAVEFATLHEMPHTVYTFLTLVEAGLYHESSLQRQPVVAGQTKDIIQGGSPATAVRKQNQSKLMRKYAELGYSGVKPLLFTERSTTPCGPYGFALNSAADLVIQLTEDDSDTADDSVKSYQCPGRVVSGQDSLQQIQSGERVTIVDARIIQTTQRDEL